MTQDSIVSKKEQLVDLEKSEKEAQRLQSALTRQPISRASVLTDEGTEQSEGGNAEGEVSTSPQGVQRERDDENYAGSSSVMTSTLRRRGTGIGLLNALSHSLHGMMDVDPETARRNNITKIRENVTQVHILYTLCLCIIV